MEICYTKFCPGDLLYLLYFRFGAIHPSCLRRWSRERVPLLFFMSYTYCKLRARAWTKQYCLGLSGQGSMASLDLSIQYGTSPATSATTKPLYCMYVHSKIQGSSLLSGGQLYGCVLYNIGSKFVKLRGRRRRKRKKVFLCFNQVAEAKFIFSFLYRQTFCAVLIVHAKIVLSFQFRNVFLQESHRCWTTTTTTTALRFSHPPSVVFVELIAWRSRRFMHEWSDFPPKSHLLIPACCELCQMGWATVCDQGKKQLIRQTTNEKLFSAFLFSLCPDVVSQEKFFFSFLSWQCMRENAHLNLGVNFPGRQNSKRI